MMSVLLDCARKLLCENPDAAQVVLVSTAREHVFHMLSRNFPIDMERTESEFCEMLKSQGDTHILHLLCMWQNGTVDLPSWHLRQLLTQLNPENQNTLVLLNTQEGLREKPFHALLPK